MQVAYNVVVSIKKPIRKLFLTGFKYFILRRLFLVQYLCLHSY